MARSSAKDDESYSAEETVQRRDAALKRMLSMPPKPHADMKVGKAKPDRRGSQESKSGKSTRGQGRDR